MKCPSCGAKGNWREQFKGNDSGEKYECPQCSAVLERRYSFGFIMMALLIGTPIIEVLIRGIVGTSLYLIIGNIKIFGLELWVVLTNGIIICIMIAIFFILNQYQVVTQDKSDQ